MIEDISSWALQLLGLISHLAQFTLTENACKIIIFYLFMLSFRKPLFDIAAMQPKPAAVTACLYL